MGQKPVSDVNILFESSKVFLHISRAEGLSYALLEALYSGLLVICSDIPENMVVKNCPTARFVQNENIEEISSAMLDAIEYDDPEYTYKVNETRRIIESEFSLEAWVGRIINIYFAQK